MSSTCERLPALVNGSLRITSRSVQPSRSRSPGVKSTSIVELERLLEGSADGFFANVAHGLLKDCAVAPGAIARTSASAGATRASSCGRVRVSSNTATHLLLAFRAGRAERGQRDREGAE